MSMQTRERLEKIRPIWISRISHRLAQGQDVRESFLEQLIRFYELMLDSIETGNPSRLDPLLCEWAQARTQSELEAGMTEVPPILNYFLISLYEIAAENLEPKDALTLLGSLLPVFLYAFEFTARRETQLHVEHISAELERANLALERLDKNKSDFISVAAHELRTPLTLIEGYTMMLREALPQVGNVAEAALYMRGIDAGSGRLREIVNDMVDVSMIDNHLLDLNFQPMWLNRLFTMIRKELRNIIAERDLNLIIEPFEGADEMMFGDGERIMQALRNVIMNAIKFTPDGGQVKIDGRLLPGFIEIRVSDNGIGIDPENHLRIFEKFGRLGNISLHSSSKSKYKGGGPGLGLPIAKGIIESHGGAIWVESEGCDEKNFPGSCVHILLPFRKEAPSEKTGSLFKHDHPTDTEPVSESSF
jgi:signal transduction histidine kinase